MATDEEIREVMEFRAVPLYRAAQILKRRELCTELRHDETLNDATDTLIRILQYEFGDDYEG